MRGALVRLSTGLAVVLGLCLSLVAPADAASPGSVRLTVTDAETGAPLAGACANAEEGPSPGLGCTNASGVVVIGDLLPATYRFTIDPPEGYNFNAIEGVVVRKGKVTRASATLEEASVLVVNLEDRATGAPVTGACVDFVEPDDYGVTQYGAAICADGDGQVRLSSFQSRFRMFVEPNDGVHGAQWIAADGGTGDLDQAMWVQTSTGTTQQVTALLDPAGSIRVTATDAATGAGIDQACPWVAPQGLIGNVYCSGSDGEYLLSGLGPYAWDVEVADYSGTHAWQWSGDVASRDQATPITVTAGQATPLSVRLPVAGRVTGTVVGATIPYQYVSVFAVNTTTGDIAGPGGWMSSDYGYTLTGLAGQQVKIGYDADSAETPRWYPDPIQVTQGATVTGIDLQVPSTG